MRALLKKELTEVLVPFGAAFVVIVIAWLMWVRFWNALLPPADEMLMFVALSCALSGAALGYVQFSAERWRGKLGYLCHRGTGVDGASFAKTTAGLLGTALVGLVPPFVYALSASLFSPNASIIDWSILSAYVSAATVGASLYGLCALAASLRRRAVVGILLIPLGGGVLWVISETIGTPWGNAASEWPFPVMHLAIGAALLLLVLRLTRSEVDRDLPLPRGVHLAMLALVVPLVLLPCDMGSSILQSTLLSEVRSEYPVIVRDREKGEFFTVVVGEDGRYFRLGAHGQQGERVDVAGFSHSDQGNDVVFWGNGGFGVSAIEPPSDPSTWMRLRSFATRRGLTPIWRDQGAYQRDRHVSGDSPPFTRVFLDRKRGSVRAFGILSDTRQQFTGEGIRRVPFAIELRKADGGHSFSPTSVVLDGQGDAVGRLLQESALADPTGLEPGIKLLACLFDPEDGTAWRLDVLDPEAPLTQVELPGEDTFVRLDPLYYRNELFFGRFQESWDDPVVVGEKGRYSWNGREFVEFIPSEQLATASDVEKILRFRVVVDDADPVRWTVRVLDARDDRELFIHAYAPGTGFDALLSAAAQGAVLLRSPLANTLVFTKKVQQRSQDDMLQVRFESIIDGRRPWLFFLDDVFALGCAALCVRMLRRRSAPAYWIGAGAVYVLLFGPVALLVVWLLEPKGFTRELAAARAEPEPALVIQSV